MKKTIEIDGFFTVSQAERIKEKLQGKTYMEFNVTIGGGYMKQISIDTEYKTSREDIKQTVLHYLLNSL